VISVSPRHKAIVSFAILVTFVLLFAGYISPAFGQSVSVVLTTPDQTSLLAPQTPLELRTFRETRRDCSFGR
jgi:hypothetical protein